MNILFGHYLSDLDYRICEPPEWAQGRSSLILVRGPWGADAVNLEI